MFKSLIGKEKRIAQRKQLAKLKVEHRKAVAHLSKKHAELRDCENKVSELEEEVKHLRYLRGIKTGPQSSGKSFSLNGYVNRAKSLAEVGKAIITVDMGSKGLTTANQFQFLVPSEDSCKLVGRVVKVTIEQLPKNYNPAIKQ